MNTGDRGKFDTATTRRFHCHFIFATAFGVCLVFYIFAVPLIILGFISILVFKLSRKACLLAPF